MFHLKMSKKFVSVDIWRINPAWSLETTEEMTFNIVTENTLINILKFTFSSTIGLYEEHDFKSFLGFRINKTTCASSIEHGKIPCFQRIEIANGRSLFHIGFVPFQRKPVCPQWFIVCKRSCSLYYFHSSNLQEDLYRERGTPGLHRDCYNSQQTQAFISTELVVTDAFTVFILGINVVILSSATVPCQ